MATTPRALDPLSLREVFSAFPSGVVALAALIDGRPVGMAASTFAPVSLDPPLVSVCIARTSATWPLLRMSRTIGLSVLSANQQDACKQLSAKQSNDRFHGLQWTSTHGGAVMLTGASAWLECIIDKRVPAGDHDIAVLQICDLDGHYDIAPLVFHGSQFRAITTLTGQGSNG
jgi:flavin reductase (DIM6/NTAB) family NADH-FMN oxidoreductase RutF